MIFLPEILYNQIIESALDGISEEICGVIGGVTVGADKYIVEIYQLENTDHSPIHFSVNSAEHFAAVKDMRSKGLEPLGCFHSHINSLAYPSDEDKRLAFDRTASYMIVSLVNRESPMLKSFAFNGMFFEEEPVIKTNVSLNTLRGMKEE